MKTITLNEREKLLVKVLLGVVAVAIPLLIFQGAWRYQGRLMSDVETYSRLLTEDMMLDVELGRVDRNRVARGGQVSFMGLMEQIADRAGLRQRVQLNPTGTGQAGQAQAVEIKVDQATLDELVNLMYAIENAEETLVIEQAEIFPSFKEKDLLRVSLRVLGQG